MPRMGLTEDTIIKEAAVMVGEKGCESISLRELAERLGVKPPALYNHVGGIKEILTSVGDTASRALNASLAKAMEGKSRDEALIAAAYAYRNFSKESPELYKAIIRMPKTDKPLPMAMGLSPLRDLISGYGLPFDKQTHYFRALRSALHGFVSLEEAGFMRMGSVSLEDSFDAMVHGFLEILLTMEHSIDENNISEDRVQ